MGKVEDSNHVVTKGNTFIEGRYSLSLTAHKLLLALLAKVDPTTRELPEFRITEKELIALDIGVSEKTAKRNFTTACVELLKLHLNYYEKDVSTGELDEIAVNVFTKTNRRWVNSKRTKLKEVRFKFSPDITPFISNFEAEIRYTKYLYKHVRKLPTSHSIRLYELLRRWRNLDEKKFVITRVVDIESLRYMLGIDLDAQKTFANFKKNILTPSQDAISKSTDIRFEFEDVKANKSRKVTHIRFSIFSNDTPDIPLAKPASFDTDLASKLQRVVPKTKDNQEMLYWFFHAYPVDVLDAATSAMAFDLLDGKDIKARAKYLKGICDNIVKEQPKRVRKSTREQLTDTSWADDDWFEQFEGG